MNQYILSFCWKRLMLCNYLRFSGSEFQSLGTMLEKAGPVPVTGQVSLRKMKRVVAFVFDCTTLSTGNRFRRFEGEG